MLQRIYPDQALEARGASPPLATVGVSSCLVACLEALALAGLVIACTGYRFGTGMQLMLVPYVRRLADSQHLSNDWLIGLVPKHYNVTWLLAVLSRLADFELIFFLAHVATTFLFVFALRRLSQVLFGGGAAFYLALFLLLRWGTGGLGGNLLFGDYFNPHYLGVPFCALALACVLEGRFVRGALLAAIATNVHLLLGLNTFLLLAIVSLLADRPFDRPALLRGSLLYVLVAAPAILPVLVLAGGSEALDSAEFLRIHVWMRNPHHYAPSTWPLSDYAKFGFIVLFAAVASLRHRPQTEIHRRVLAFCGGVAIFCLGAAFAVEVVPLELVTKLQFFRMTIFVRLLAALYVANFLGRALEERGPRLLGALALLAAPPRLALLLPAAGLALTPEDSIRRRAWLIGVGAAAAALAIVIAHDSRLPAGLPQNRATAGTVVAMVLGAIVLAALLTLTRRLAPPRRQGRIVALSLLILFTGMGLAKGTTFEYRLPDPTTDPWVEVCRWIHDHTPRDAVFVAPPYRGDFRLLAERAEIVDFKGNTFWEDGIVEWKRRLENLANTSDLDCQGIGPCRRALRAGYALLGEADFERLSRKYGADYVVTEEELPSFPLMHSNQRFHVYRVPGRDRRSRLPQTCITQTAANRAVNAATVVAARCSSHW
jgi:Domain of unknown function (DUF6798)